MNREIRRAGVRIDAEADGRYRRNRGLPIYLGIIRGREFLHEPAARSNWLQHSGDRAHRLTGQQLPVFGDGLHVRDYLHVPDHVRVIELIMRTPETIGGTYLIAVGSERSTLDIAKHVLAALRLPESPLEHVQDRPGQIPLRRSRALPGP